MIEKYRNREEAGNVLAHALAAYAGDKNAIVLALPRGGVPVAYEIAKTLYLPLDVFIVRKLGVPGHKELAMGALATGNVIVFNEEIINSLNVSNDEINTVIGIEQNELKRREALYRGNLPYPTLKDKTIILVDDGIATGATMRVAIKALEKLGAEHIVIAVPVAQKQLADSMASLVESLVCPLKPVHFHAVGAWYDDFNQTEDDEVRLLLEKARGFKVAT